MTKITPVPAGGYGFLPGAGLPFSNGVVADTGHSLTRVRLRRPLPLAEGMAFAAEYLRQHNRPLAALAACELRSPVPMTPEGFGVFNAEYAAQLKRHGLGAADSFPVARSNMAPLFDTPSESTLFAFTFTQSSDTGGKDFVIAGKPENTPEGMIAPGDTSPEGMRAKAFFVIDQLRTRITELNAAWSDVTGAQIYTTHSLDPILQLLGDSGLAGVGPALFPGYPPIIGYAFEIDVRAISTELTI